MKIFKWLKKDTKAKTVPLETITVGTFSNSSGTLETNSSTWRYVSGYIFEQLDILRKRNDNPTHTIEKTQLLRGEIKALKKILALPEQLDNDD